MDKIKDEDKKGTVALDVVPLIARTPVDLSVHFDIVYEMPLHKVSDDELEAIIRKNMYCDQVEHQKKKKRGMEESVLTEFVRADLEQIGYTTYAEVCDGRNSSHRCDMYARIEDPKHSMYGMTIAFEAKLNFNLKVLEQANHWKVNERATEVYVIIPTTYRDMSSRRFARQLCAMLGIGVMEVNIDRDKYNITVKPTRCESPKIPELYEEQKAIIASNSGNNYMTPFKRTVLYLNEHMDGKESVPLMDACRNIRHHYKNDIKASRNLRMMVEQGVIRGFEIVREGSKLVIKKVPNSGI